jgi:hypothetical protein
MATLPDLEDHALTVPGTPIRVVLGERFAEMDQA